MDWRWAWSNDGGTSWARSAWHGVPRCPKESCSAHLTKRLTGLEPGSHYIFRLVTRLSNGDLYYGDSNGSHEPPYEYDSFDTPPARAGYPSLRQIDYDGDFDPGGRLVGGPGGWQQNVI